MTTKKAKKVTAKKKVTTKRKVKEVVEDKGPIVLTMSEVRLLEDHGNRKRIHELERSTGEQNKKNHLLQIQNLQTNIEVLKMHISQVDESINNAHKSYQKHSDKYDQVIKNIKEKYKIIEDEFGYDADTLEIVL